ncbi:MAG: hypothetical protein HXS46_01050 [Theionarchaea archaeon]|nr:hypothetical protein [Theionarchaea archaeon]
MIWIIMAVILFIVIAGLFLFWRTLKKVESKEAQNVVRWSIGMSIGGIAGIVIGIILVEFAGYSYPLPFILWMLGMAVGQISVILYNRSRE